MVEETRDCGDPSLSVSEGSEQNDKVHHRAERVESTGREGGDGGEGDGGRHTLSTGLILSQSPTITKRPVRIPLNGSN